MQRGHLGMENQQVCWLKAPVPQGMEGSRGSGASGRILAGDREMDTALTPAPIPVLPEGARPEREL